MIWIALLCICAVSPGYSQNRTDVTITVLDENSQPLIGANVVIKGTGNGGTTDSSGKVVLNAASTDVVTISFISYRTQEITVGSNTNISVIMEMDAQQLTEVAVIGSRNQNRTVLETAVPVDIIPLEDIVKDAPQVELGQILNYIAPSFSSNRQTIADGSDHVDPAALRGLGVDHVLVLINGKRRHASSLVNVNGSVGRGSVGTDLNTIPAAAIERIEVLRDGAAAQYGSDAIAGVINIVLKETTNNMFFSGTLGQTSEGDGDRAQFNTNYGFKIGNKGFVNITGQYQFRGRTNRAGVTTSDIYRTNGSGVYSENFAEGDFSPFDVGKRLTQSEADAINAANNITNNLTDAEQEAMIDANGGRKAFTMKVGQSESINTALMLNSAVQIGEGTEFYFFGGINSRRGKATGFYRLPNQNRTVTSIYPNGFLPEINSRIFDGSLAAGVRGKLKDWNVDFSNTYGTNAFNFIITNTLNASRGTSSPTSFDAGGFRFQQNTTNLDFSRYYDDVMSGVNVAFGAEYRQETYEIFAGEEGSYRNYGNVNVIDTLADGTPFSNEFNQTNIFYGRPGGSQVFPGFQPANELKENRGNIALYGDIEFNLSESFFVDAAVRFENYTDFGKTFNWKLAARWSANEKLAFRAAASTGFRAPSLQQRYFNSTSTLFQLNSQGVSVPNEVGTFRNDSKLAQLFGIPGLTNESSMNFSVGITYSILDNLDLTIDGYQISVYDRVVLTGSFSNQSPEIQAILDEANAGSATFFVNAIDTKTQGIDIILAHKASLGSSSLRSTLAANFGETEVTKINVPSTLNGATDSFFGHEEKGRFEDAMPRSKVNLAFNFSVGKFNANLSNTRFGSVWARTGAESDPSSWIDQEFAAKVITDLSLGYNIADGVKFTIGANNLLDVYPDENRPEFRSGESFVYSRRVSQFGFAGRFYFVRLNFNI